MTRIGTNQKNCRPRLTGTAVDPTGSADLIEDLNKAQAIKALPQRVRLYRAFDLLIIDEFGFEKLERREYPDALSLLYKVIHARNGRGSTAVVTNVNFADWTDYFDDPPLVMAMLDRVVDSSIIIKFEGQSYRAARAEKKRPGAKPAKDVTKHATHRLPATEK